MTCRVTCRVNFIHTQLQLPCCNWVEFATGREVSNDQQESSADQTDSNKPRRKKGMQPLCRPIIAVCNDIYAPALRPLRAVAKVIQFKKPTVGCDSQGITFADLPAVGHEVHQPALLDTLHVDELRCWRF